MKLRLPRALVRALIATFTALVSSSLAAASTASSSVVTVRLTPPDVEQTDTMLCWAASAADMLAVQTGQDATAIYRCITQASGNSSGYVETALSWYKAGAKGQLEPQRYDGSYTITRRNFDSLYALANSLDEALKESRAASIMLYLGGDRQGMGHAVTVYASEFENGRLYFSYVDSADGVQGLQRAEVVEHEMGFALAGTDYVIHSLSYLGDNGAEDEASEAAPVGGYMHSSPTLLEYTDLAAGSGIYRFGYGASLIAYQNGEPTYVLQKTPSFTSTCDAGYFTLVNNGSFHLTVDHNGIMTNNTYSSRYVGEYAQKYSGVGIRFVNNFSSGEGNQYIPTGVDYRIERVTRLATDATSSAFCTDTSLLNNLTGTLAYRVGGGTSGVFSTTGVLTEYDNWGYYGITAGITSISGYSVANTAAGDVYTYIFGYSGSDFTQTSDSAPLPTSSGAGDSGSPFYIYNESTQQFEIVGVLQSGSKVDSYTRYNPEATTDTIDYMKVDVTAGGTDTIYLAGASMNNVGDTITDGDYTAVLYQGTITQGDSVTKYNGVALDVFTEGTWDAMSEEMYNSNTWYTYEDSALINVNTWATAANDFGMKDLFYTHSLQFFAQAATQAIELTDDVDLGVGYMQFSLAEGQEGATFNLGKDSSGNSLSTSGFIVDKGVTLNNYLTYEAGRELRRVGEGVMNIVGTGDNNVLLNIGGGGLTYLDRTDGYGAYNVFVGTGATLRLADIGQVKHNVTLGAGGGTLDLNGNDYTWSASEGNADGHFSLTVYEGANRVETSAIANLKEGTVSTVTITRDGDFEFAGAFRDGSTYTGGSSIEMDSRYTMMPSDLISYYTQYEASQRQDSASVLKVVYNGTGTMTMTGVYTILTGSNEHGESGLTVASGRVLLQGTNTIHANGSVDCISSNRWSNAEDWHFAMAETDVQVQNGATFELGHHSLLIGDVNVEAGGSYVMKQAVNNSHEYVEGWYFSEDMSELADYYGHKGNVSLAAGASMLVAFDEGVSTTLTYGGNISGEGSLTVAAGEGRVNLTGQNSFLGEKTAESGYVHVAEGAQGDTSENKWLIKEQASLVLDAVDSLADIEAMVDTSSTGVLALTHNITEQINGSTMPGLIIGAAEGETVHYGSSDVALQAVNNQWTLGGGGGTLYVDFLLEDAEDGTANKLVLGNAYSSGIVVLNNAANSFTGGIDIVGNITLEYTSLGALGAGTFAVSYGSVLNAEASLLADGRLKADSDGVFGIKAENGGEDLDLSGHRSLSLGAAGAATLSGKLTVADDAAYRFGGAGELTVSTSLSGRHGIVVDGQGSTGSQVILAQASLDSGAVVVQGYEAGKATEGSVMLTLAAGNALATASSVTLQNNGILNLNGTNQTLGNLSGDASGILLDAVGGNTLTLNISSDSSFNGSLLLSGTDVVKVSAGTLSLSGTNLWKSFSIEDGTVQAAEGKSLGGEVSVQSGATLHLTQDVTLSHVVNIAGYGADGQSAALLVTNGTLYNSSAALNVVADAAISGHMWFTELNLKGNALTVKNGDISFSDVSGDGGHIILQGGSWLTSMNGSGYDVQVNTGAGISLNGTTGGAGTSIILNGGTFYMSEWPYSESGDTTYAGNISLTSAGGTISNAYRNDDASPQFNLTGKISGTEAEGKLVFTAGNDKARAINVQGGLDVAGDVELTNAVTVNLQRESSIGGALCVGANATAVIAHQVSVGSLVGSGAVSINGAAASLQLASVGTNFEGTLSVEQGILDLTGLASGSSLGTISTLTLAENGQIALSGLGAYSSETSGLLYIDSLTAAGSLELDLVGLEAGTYRLLTSASDLAWFETHSNVAGSDRMSLVSTQLSDGSYALDLNLTSKLATVTWNGTGTLTAGTPDEDHISTDEGGHVFLALDSLILTADAGSTETLTLGSEIQASSITYTGAGTLQLALGEGGKFTAGTAFVLDAAGMFDIGETKALTGTVELKAGTLAATTDSLNAMKSISVTGETAGLELSTATHVTTGINIAEDATLTVSIRKDTAANQWGANFDDNLSGKGTLVFDGTSGQELHLNGSHDAFIGTIDVQGGVLRFGTEGSNASIGATLINVGRGATLGLNAADFSLAADVNWGSVYSVLNVGQYANNSTLSGTQTISGELTIQGNTAGKQLNITGDVKDGANEAGSLQLFGEAGDAGFKLVLSGNNSYSGGTTMNMTKGTVYAGNTNALGTGAVNLNAGTLSWQGVTTRGKNIWNGDLAVSKLVLGGGSLDTNGQDVTFSKAVEGSGALIKQGEGTLTLSGELSYTGATEVQAGTLALASQLTSSASLSVASGAELSLGVAGNSVRSMSLADGSTLTLGGSLSGAVALNVANGLSLGNGLTLNLTGELEAGDTFSLTAGSITNGDALWNVEAETRVSVSQVNTGTTLTFTVDSVGAANLVWQGTADSNNWNTDGANKVWLNNDAEDHFFRHATATFGAEGHKAVAVDAEGVHASAISITADGYSFTGGTISTKAISVADNATATMYAKLISSDDLVYSGKGTLRLEGGQDITGTLRVTDGTVTLLSASGLNGGAEIEADGTLSLYTAGQEWNGGNLRGEGTVRLDGGRYTAGSIAKAFISSGGEGVFSGTVAIGNGSTLSVNASASADQISGSVASLGTIIRVEQGGLLSMDAAGYTLTNGVEMAGGTLNFNRSGSIVGAFNISSASVLSVAAGQEAALSGSISGEGLLTKSGAGVLEIGGLVGDGQLKVAEGILSIASEAELGSLSMVASSTLEFTGEHLLKVASVNLNQVSLSLADGLKAGHYELMQITGEGDASGILSQLSLASDSRLVYDLGMADNLLTLDIVGTADGALVWQGTTEDKVWDAAATHKPWNVALADSEDSAETYFMRGDDVRFTAEGSHEVVVGANGVQAGAVQLEDGGYNISGGEIAASSVTDTAASGTNSIATDLSVSGALSKEGEGTLELSGNNSLGSVELKAGKLVAASDGALGDATVTFSEGAALYVKDDAEVTNTLAGGNYTVGADKDEAGSFSGNAASSLLSSGFTKEGEGEVTVVNSKGENPTGSIAVNAGTLAYDAGSSTLNAVSGNGTLALVGGTVTIGDMNQFSIKNISVTNATLKLDWNETLDSRNLELGTGAEMVLGYWCNLNNSELLMKSGASLRVGSVGFSGNSVTVDGSGVISVGQTSGTKDGTPLLNVNSTVTGNGTLYVTNYTGENVDLVYTTHFNNVISDGSNGTLAVSTNQGDLHFHAANTYSGGTAITGGKLTTHNASALGTGSVTLSGGTLALASDLNINNLSGTSGTVEMGANDLHVTQSVAGSYAGGLSGTGVFTKDGTAALSLTGTGLSAETLVVEQGVLNVNSITLSGALDMNLAEGTGLNITNLTMLEGSSLVYTGTNNYASVENVSGSLLLNLDAVTNLLTQDGGYDLGLDLSRVSTTVQGYESGSYSIELDDTTGHSIIRLADSLYGTVEWDENWGVSDTAGKVWHTELSENTSLVGTKYDNGTRTAISVTGTEGTINLYATAGDGSSPTRDAWVEVTGGSIGTLAGSSGGSITGNTHFMVSGGTVEDVIGFNATSANGAPTHTGNSYITVEEGASVTGSIIGAGVSTNGSDGSTLNGNTNIFVYNVLSEGTASTGEASNSSKWNYNAIIGGFARTLDYGVEWKIDGSTNVNVDVADYSGEAANFVKSIYGGNASERFSHIGTITGNANVSIAANDKVTFTENIVAGSLKGGTEAERADIIKGNTTLSIDGGVYTGGTEKFLIGGSWVTGGTSTIEGTASVILTGDAQINRHVYVAGYSGGGSSSVGATRLEIGKDVTFGSGIKLSGGFTSSANGTVKGDRTLALADGVDLSSNSGVTLENFSHLEVASGSAKLNAGKLASTVDIHKTGNGALTLAGDTLSWSSSPLAITVDAAANKTTDFAELTISAAITGNVHINKNGSGTLKLSGSNTFAYGFNLNEGRVIAASDSALGVGSIDVAAGATVEIAKGTHALIHHHLNMVSGSELIVHELSTEKAAFATDGTNMTGGDARSSLGALTLTLEKDIELDAVSGYKVISLGDGGSLASGVTAGDMKVNYEGNGRFSFSTRFESNTLLLDVAKDDNADLVWDGTEEGAAWNQLAQNKNWERADELGADTSFMNLDSVSFTDAAAHKNVAVAEEGVQVQSMTVSAEGYSFSGGAVKTDSASLQETVSLEQGASLNLGTVYTVSQQDSKAAGSVAAVVMTSDLSAMKGAIQGAVEGAQARLDNVVIDIAKGASLELNDVLLSQNSRITDDPATVSMNNVTVELGAANTTIEGLTTVPSALVATGGDASFNLEADTSIVSVFCSALDTVTVTGTSLTLDLSGIANSLSTDWKDSEYVAISFGQSKDSLAHFDGKNLSITATYDGSTYNTVYVKMDEQSSTTTLYVANKASDAVPEPTTATLSLLALSMLAARRRRK